MKRSNGVWLQAAVGVVALVAGAAAAGAARHVTELTRAEAGRDCETVAQAFTAYPVLYAGAQFRGMPISGCERVQTATKYDLNGSVREPAMDYFVITYGTCTATEEAGCPAPIQIITDPPCAPTLSALAVREAVEVRGAEVAVKSDGSLRIEAPGFKATVYALAGSYATERDNAIVVVQALRGANARAAALTAGVDLDVPLGGNAVCS